MGYSKNTATELLKNVKFSWLNWSRIRMWKKSESIYCLGQKLRICFKRVFSEDQPGWNRTFFFFPLLLGLHLWHMEVPRLEGELELQLPAYATATATPDLSCICDLHHSSQQHRVPNPLSEWPGIEPTSSWILVGFVTAELQWELQGWNRIFLPILLTQVCKLSICKLGSLLSSW